MLKIGKGSQTAEINRRKRLVCVHFRSLHWEYFKKKLPLIGNQEQLQKQHDINRMMQK